MSFDGAQAKSRATKRWELPQKNAVDVIDNEWIVLMDGTRLSARLWLPAGARQTPAPIVWEYIPYRKRDFTRMFDDLWGHELAQYGVAYARVDARGSGDSEGALVDEYLDQELNDGVEVIAWLARQPWSNGNVGMRGISWGGINTLEIAALSPPELKAIMPMCCTDTRYTDDAHYIGGSLGMTNLQWGASFKGVMVLPPDPAIVGERWRELWRERLNATPNILQKWLSHQRNDAFWQRGSVSGNYAGIKCPVYIVDGWVDTYVNTVPRILEHITAPRKALVGPWGHSPPQWTSPGPSLDWAHEEVRWWKHWLAGERTGIMDEPMLRAYMPYQTAWETYPANTPGRWVAEAAWPPPTTPHTWYLDDGRLAPTAGAHGTVVYFADKVVGLQKPEWLPFPPEGMPGEQTSDDKKSLLFDTRPLDADVEILGHPVARIRVAADRAVAKLALRLCEVTPEGKSWLVTYGLLNLTHRDGHEHPAALTAGQSYDVKIDLSLIAHRFKKGNRIRLAVSESLWPLVWPSPEVVTLTLTHGASSLELPVRPPVSDPSFPIPVNPPAAQQAAGPLFGSLKESGPDAEGWYDLRQDPPPMTSTVSDTGTTITGGYGLQERLRMRDGDNSSCTWEGAHTGGFKRGDWDCTIHVEFKLSSTPDTFMIEETVRALEGDKVIFERISKSPIGRDLM
jgi:hypothetical protein